ncbi:hypothetical protein Py17XNL_000801787 [Plasmodium yoelii yoelii]|uniref:EGF-like domain-containing protein n=1 Tax=Plasmodium yoelii yoelii TaxID=73239 RepID=A0AAF0AZJ7_PLAYO|nr:hypothetical protein Py17XNL_000801787 [Plasmodium yoelii yoelii]
MKIIIGIVLLFIFKLTYCNNHNEYISYDKTYKYLVDISKNNNKLICVEKEYNNLIYYTHNNECDPHNTFSFSFNSTFNFDEEFYIYYKNNKNSFIETEISPYMAIGSCINCLFLDEINLLSLYGYTFIYNNSDDYYYKTYYKGILDLYHDAEVGSGSGSGSSGSSDSSDSSGSSGSGSSGSGSSDSSDSSGSGTFPKQSEANPVDGERESGVIPYIWGEKNKTKLEINSINGLHNIEIEKLDKFLKDNTIHYTNDEINKENENTSNSYDYSLNKKIINDFFMNFKEKSKISEYTNGKSLLNNNKDISFIDTLTNIVYKKNECKKYMKDINKQKIWSNIIFINFTKNLNILSHIKRYSGTYRQLKDMSLGRINSDKKGNINNNYNFFNKNSKINEYIKNILDLNNKEYLINNNLFILLANDDVKQLDEIIFCSKDKNNYSPLFYINNKNISIEYENIKNKYMSTNGNNYVFLIKVLFFKKKIKLILVDYIRGVTDPMKLAIPFFFFSTHSFFSQFVHFFIKDNLIGWIQKSKVLYLTSIKKIISYLFESTIYSKKKYDVISIENKIISNIFLLDLCHSIFKFVIFGRYNPIKDYSLYKSISFESILLNMISTFKLDELTNYKKYFEKITKKETNNIINLKKIKRMDIFEIIIVPSNNYINFQKILSNLFKAIFDCGGKHVSKILQIAIPRAHYDMLYSFNCYNYQLHSFLVNLLDLHNYYYEHADVDNLFKESHNILKQLINLSLDEMVNLIPFNHDKNLIKYFIIILYFGNDMFCLDKENSTYIQLIHELRYLNISHAIMIAYLSGDKIGTLCLWETEKNEEKNEIVEYKKNIYDVPNILEMKYTTFPDSNIYLKKVGIDSSNIIASTSMFLKRFNNIYFGDIHLIIENTNKYVVSIFLVSFMASVVLIAGELVKDLKRIYIYRIFKNIFIQNYAYNITKYYTFWNTKIYGFSQYEPECMLLFNKYNLYEKYYNTTSTLITDSLSSQNIASLKKKILDKKMGKIVEKKNEQNEQNGQNGQNGQNEQNGQKNPDFEHEQDTPSSLTSQNKKSMLYQNEELIKYFSQKKNSCLCDKNMINKSKGEYVVSEYLELRYKFMNKIKKTNTKLYEKMLNYNFFNDPLDISYKTKHFENEQLIDICKDIKFQKNNLCLFHKSRIILTYLYLLSSQPDFIFYVISPLVFIKPQKYCDKYDIPLVLNHMLKNRNFYKKSSKICINYAFAHFISIGDQTKNLVITAKLSGTMVNINASNLLLLLPMSKRVDILDYSQNNEYDIKEEILNEYFILGNPYTPINIISYTYKEYDKIKKNSHVTILGAFIKQNDKNFVTYHNITENYDTKAGCSTGHMFELDGKPMCFCNILSNQKNNENSEHIKDHHTYKNCIYPFCEQSKQFCYLNEKCVDGKCVCIDGYSRNPMSSLCEKNNECVLNSKDVCKDPGMCVLADNRYVCLCPFPYVRVFKDCLHPMTAIKMKLIIFSNFKNDFSNDENDAFKKENFYINVFGSMPQYIKEAINSIIKTDLRYRIYVKPIKKFKHGIKTTVIINQRTDPNEPTPIEVFNIFLNQLSDSRSALNNGFYSYFARFTYIEYVHAFSTNEHISSFYESFIKYLPNFLINNFKVDLFNETSIFVSIYNHYHVNNIRTKL